MEPISFVLPDLVLTNLAEQVSKNTIQLYAAWPFQGLS